MFKPDSPVVWVSPDLTLDQFAGILAGTSIPKDDIVKAYNTVVAWKISPAFILAIFWHESQFGRLGICRQFNTKSPGNTRSSLLYDDPLIQRVTTPQGVYIRYPDWPKGFSDLAARFVEPDYVYDRRKLTTIEQILPVFAPVGDGNDPAAYIQAVVNQMNGWLFMSDPTNKVDIVHAGKGRDGHQAEVIVLHVQEGDNYLPDYFRSSGDDATIWCQKDGTLVRMELDSDSAWTNGLMVEPLDHTNPHVQSLLARGVANSNDYSLTIEHQGFAADQFSDAAIEATAHMCAYWMQQNEWTDVDTRILGHYQIGEHKNCPGPNFPWGKLRQRVKELLGLPMFDPNPKKYNVGPGVLEVLVAEGMVAITNEDYFTPNSGEKLGQRSFTYAQDAAGVTYQIEAIQEVDADGKPTGPWTRQLYKFIKEYK